MSDLLTDASTPRGNRPMLEHSTRYRLKSLLMACAAGVALIASPAFAQQVDPNRLLEVMVQKGLVTQTEADAMRAEAAATSAPVQRAQPPIPQGGVAADGTQTIPYVPQVVRDQIVQQVRTELAGQAQTEGWARPGETPEWTRRIQFYGDVRVRGEGRFFEKPVFNDLGGRVSGNSDEFVNWGAINRGAGFQANDGAPSYVNPPYLNTTEDRRRAQLRARFGLRARITDAITADIRVATGADNSPISTNQTLGADGSSNYSLWLDRASIRVTPFEGVNLDFGRFANPFWTSDLIYDADLNFDGVAISGTHAIGDRFNVFGAAGAFPVFNTDLNFGSRDAGAFASKDKYLLAVQAGIEFRPTESLRARIAGGYFHYDGVQGQFSSPCRWDQDVCDTDATRPSFQQFGNTMFALRNITPNPGVPQGVSPEVQYFGLASKYELLNVSAQLEYQVTERAGVRLDGDYVRNLGFDRSAIEPLALNNFAPMIGTTRGQYDGGDTGWQMRLVAGDLDLGVGDSGWTAERGRWAAHVAYRHLESDAVIDGFADSDLGLGGTNVKGWIAGANYGVAHNTALGVRWMSSDEIVGPPLSVDRLFLDLSARF